MKTISELKKIVKDGMFLQSENDTVKIRRFPNNIIQIYGKSVSWVDFQDLLINGNYKLLIKEEQKELDFKQTGRGGRRLGSGRKKIDPAKKKVVKSVSLSPEIFKRLDRFVDFKNKVDGSKVTISSVIEQLIIKGIP
ncbi:MAG: hypothetical protein MI799_23370 [Desulfobacterales bacterium]|nr:hypothetical protein [Desulfobacterales bacterium]